MNDLSFASQGAGRSDADMARRAELIAQVNDLKARDGLSNAECARQSGIGHGTFSQWLGGNYEGRYDTVNGKVAAWLENKGAMAEVTATVPKTPSFLPLAFSENVIHALTIAQVMPTMVMVTAEAGIGKTTSAKHYVSTRANTYLVTVSPHTRSVHNMLAEIAAAIGCEERNPGRLVRAIGQRLQRVGDGTLLIVDEAQNLSDDAINQLRHFVDNNGCGVALLGNTATYQSYARWTKGDKFGQLTRRIFKRINVERPKPEDLAAFIGAWGITDPKQVEFLTGVGLKPGALGQVDMTIKLAQMVAQGAGRQLTLADLRAAWSNRDVEVA